MRLARFQHSYCFIQCWLWSWSFFSSVDSYLTRILTLSLIMNVVVFHEIKPSYLSKKKIYVNFFFHPTLLQTPSCFLNFRIEICKKVLILKSEQMNSLLKVWDGKRNSQKLIGMVFIFFRFFRYLFFEFFFFLPIFFFFSWQGWP